MNIDLNNEEFDALRHCLFEAMITECDKPIFAKLLIKVLFIHSKMKERINENHTIYQINQ